MFELIFEYDFYDSLCKFKCFFLYLDFRLLAFRPVVFCHRIRFPPDFKVAPHVRPNDDPICRLTGYLTVVSSVLISETPTRIM